MIIKRKLYDDYYHDPSDCACEYCGETADNTEIQKAYASGTYICGEIECWNAYCWDWVWCGEKVEVTEEEVNICEVCEEDLSIELGDICEWCLKDKEDK